MNLKGTQSMIPEWLKELEEKFCPHFGKPCIREKCWSYSELDNTSWGEEDAKVDQTNKRIIPYFTGKVIIGTVIKCRENVFQDRLKEARYALQDEAKFDMKNHVVTNPDGSPWGEAAESQIMSISEMDTDEKDELKKDMENVSKTIEPIEEEMNAEEDEDLELDDDEEIEDLEIDEKPKKS